MFLGLPNSLPKILVASDVVAVGDCPRPMSADRAPLLYLNGRDLGPLPLIERKAMLKKLIRRKRARMLYLDHVESDGCLLFEQVLKMDLEGIVCKRKDSPYKVTERPTRQWKSLKSSLQAFGKLVTI